MGLPLRIPEALRSMMQTGKGRKDVHDKFFEYEDIDKVAEYFVEKWRESSKRLRNRMAAVLMEALYMI